MGAGNNLCRLTTVYNLPEAYMLRDRLQQEGIEAHIFNEIMSAYAPAMGADIMVCEKDLELAKEKLATFRQEI